MKGIMIMIDAVVAAFLFSFVLYFFAVALYAPMNGSQHRPDGYTLSRQVHAQEMVYAIDNLHLGLNGTVAFLSQAGDGNYSLLLPGTVSGNAVAMRLVVIDDRVYALGVNR
jgi:hypothetical protein